MTFQDFDSFWSSHAVGVLGVEDLSWGRHIGDVSNNDRMLWNENEFDELNLANK